MSDNINVLLYKDVQDEPNTQHGCFMGLSYLTKATWERSALSGFVGGSAVHSCCGRAIVPFCLSGRHEVVWRSRRCKYDISIDAPVRPFHRNSGWIIKQCQRWVRRDQSQPEADF